MDLFCSNIETDNKPIKTINNQDLEKAEELFNKGSQDKAIISLEKMMVRNPKNMAAKKCLSRAYYIMAEKDASTQPNKALIFLKKSIQQDPRNTETHLLLGQVYERIAQDNSDKKQKGLAKLNFEKAQSAYLNADKLDPKGKAVLSLARVCALLGKPDLAWQSLERYLINHPDNLSETVQVLKRISEADPKNSRSLKLLAAAYQNNGQTELAIQGFKKVIDLEPKNAENHFNLGLVYFSKKEYELALASVEKAMAINPKELKYKRGISEVYYAKAFAIYESFSVGKKSWEKMLELVREALKNNPDNFNAYKLLGYIYEEIADAWSNRGEKEKAKIYYEKTWEAYLDSYRCLKKYLVNNPQDAKALKVLEIIKEKLKIKG